MRKIAEWLIAGFFIAIALSIVFVKAGQKGGVSGGQQSAMVIQAAGSGVSDVAAALEGG